MILRAHSVGKSPRYPPCRVDGTTKGPCYNRGPSSARGAGERGCRHAAADHRELLIVESAFGARTINLCQAYVNIVEPACGGLGRGESAPSRHGVAQVWKTKRASEVKGVAGKHRMRSPDDGVMPV